jgi:predicted transcriptional regulator
MLILLSFIIIFDPVAAQGDRDVNYSINLEEKVVNVDVSSPEGGSVVINGTVTLTRSTDVTVYLESAVLGNPWASKVKPDTLYFSKNGPAEQEFICIVEVPHGVPHDVSDILQVNGTWALFESITGNIPPDQAGINILQFSALEINPADTDQPYKDFDNRYDTLEFPLNFKNIGNGDDRFELVYTGVDVNGDFGIGNTIELDHEEEKVLDLKIDLPPDDNLVEYKITITASSRISEYMTSIEIYVYIDQGRAFVVSALRPILIVRYGFDLDITELDGAFVADDSKVLTVTVAAYLLPVDGISFQLTSDDGFVLDNPPAPFDLTPGEKREFELSVSYTQTNESLKQLPRRTVMVRAVGTSTTTGGEVQSNRLRLITDVKEREESDVILNPRLVAAVAGAAVVSIVSLVSLATYASSETGKYKLLGLLFVPLYTKLHKDKILDHFARGRLYEYIKLNPGVTFTALKSELELGNGTLTYHLRTLEREELIKSTKEGRNRCFYITGTKVQGPGGIKDDILGALKGVDKKIYALIADTPGISQMEIFKNLRTETNLAQRTISNHIKMMERRGIITLKRDGKDKRCYIVETATVAA